MPAAGGQAPEPVVTKGRRLAPAGTRLVDDPAEAVVDPTGLLPGRIGEGRAPARPVVFEKHDVDEVGRITGRHRPDTLDTAKRVVL